MRASSFSSVKSGGRGVGRREIRALREVVGEALVVLRPMPTTERYSLEE